MTYDIAATQSECDSVSWLNATGNWAEDCATGRRQAAEILNYIARNDAAGIFPRIVAAMPADQKQTGIHVGFWTFFAAAAALSLNLHS
jgi:hypothetical protein